MSAVIATYNESSEQTLPWYRYGWPWFLIAIPMVSVCLGSVMLYLAFNANNSMVVDDYYKEGKAYNLRIERDRLASVLGLVANITQSAEGIILELEQNTPEQLPASLESMAQGAAVNYALPESLSLRWVHVTQEKLDGSIKMTFIGANRYIAQNVSLPDAGKFRIHIEPAALSVDEATIATETTTPVPRSSELGKFDVTHWRLVSELQGFDARQAITVPAPVPEKVFTRTMLE